MGLLKNLKKKRAQAKAELKAAKTRAIAEVKATSKDRARQQKLLAKQEHRLLKAEKKGLKAKQKHEMKLAKAELEKRKAGKLNKATVSRYVGVARMVAPILLPLLYRGATQAQQLINQRKAQRMGVSTEQLSAFAGHGAPLKARIAGARNSLKNSTLPRGFVMDATERLDELDKAVDNAEFMTPEQRRRAHQSIKQDLDMVTGQVQERMVQP
ncbi:DUF6474 family protein [Corynebacterium epidermidicanis]|uniref:Uncharacterized protein n=1 Tax=Corynebacterium epidermidicanis TaxID=1050174 RepID=A0A0G3GR60_9CORY|nr:DUF6474 family protein [Corynebacterium epidermidicanis]AKK02058.1 hypothetical protein CEPID_00820 [Corynebacterium epidermidicanis]